jgi:hypothetical protein
VSETADSTIEFDYLRIVAIICLFFVHSPLANFFSLQIGLVWHYFLSCFLFSAGYFGYLSLNKYGTRWFFKRRLVDLYVPFVLVMVLYYVFGQLQHADPKALGAYAFFLNNFELLQQGSFNLGHFWFIPYLFSFYILHVAMEKITRNNLTQFLVVSALFTLNAYGWSIGSSFRFGGQFSVFVYVFWAGWWLAKKGVVREIYKLKWTPLLVAFVTVTAMFFTNLWTIPDQSRFLFFSAYYFDANILALTSIFLSLVLFSRIKINSKFDRVIGTFAATSLWIYLLEPYLSNVLTWSLTWGRYAGLYGLGLTDTLLYLPIRVIFVSIIAFMSQSFYRAALRHLRLLW